MLEFLQHVLIAAVVSYLSFANGVSERVSTLFTDPMRDTEFIALHAERPDAILRPFAPKPGLSDILRHDPNFQRAALIAASEPAPEYPVSDVQKTEELLRESLVNIYCQYTTDTYVRTTTGSGFFVSAKGVILTNAHVAQFLLLEEDASSTKDVACVIRTGDPATPRYKAELLYLSPTWIFNNAELITQQHPHGTGERDYALLYVSGTVDGAPLPERFPALPLDTALMQRDTEGKTVVIGGYPAGALIRYGSDTELAAVIVESSIGSLYTFGSNYADLFAVAGSSIGEEGVSGGPIVDAESGAAIGLIVTRGDISEGARSLRALTASYLDRAIQEETGFTLSQNMQGDIAARGTIFKEAIVPALAEILADELNDP